MITDTQILSPMATGNGAFIVHKMIESCIPSYHVIPFSPYRTLFPPSLYLLGLSSKANIIHTTPDYAFFHRRKNTPLVISFQNYVLDHFMRSHSSFLQKIHYQTDLKIFIKLAIKKADAITSVSKFTADLVKQELQASSNIKVIYNCVDHNLFVPTKNSEKRQRKTINVLFCGNLTRRKGAHWLVPIAERLVKNIKILYTSGLRTSGTLVNHLQLQNLGKIPHYEMPAIYQKADILLFPTVREGLPLAGLEAMACGLPVVATDCSSLPELIDQGKGGFLCPLGDVEAFAEKINFLAESPYLRREMGEYNRAKIEKMFTLDQMVEKYMELFEEVITNRQ